MSRANRYARSLCLWLCGLLLLSTQALAQDKTLDVTQMGREAISLTEYFAVLEDPQAALTLSDITQPAFAGRFKSGQKPAHALGFSYTRSAIWLRLDLNNPSDQPVERMLEITYALLAKVDFYLPDGQAYRHIESGYTRARSKQAQPSRYIAVPLVLPAGANQPLYVRVQTPNSLNIPARL